MPQANGIKSVISLPVSPHGGPPNDGRSLIFHMNFEARCFQNVFQLMKAFLFFNSEHDTVNVSNINFPRVDVCILQSRVLNANCIMLWYSSTEMYAFLSPNHHVAQTKLQRRIVSASINTIDGTWALSGTAHGNRLKNMGYFIPFSLLIQLVLRSDYTAAIAKNLQQFVFLNQYLRTICTVLCTAFAKMCQDLNLLGQVVFPLSPNIISVFLFRCCCGL